MNMRKTKSLLVVFAVVILFSLSSCEIESSGNGQLDGFWHLEQVDTLATGGMLDMKDQIVFWAVESTLLQTIDREIQQGYIYNFEYSDNQLVLYNPHLYNREEGDPAIGNVDELAPFGVNAMRETFVILRLDRKWMVLQSSTLRLTFRKM